MEKKDMSLGERQLKIVNNIEENRWNEFLNKCENSNIFQAPYMSLIHNRNNKTKSREFFCLDKHDNIKGLLVATKQKIFRIWKFQINRVVVYGGPIVPNNDNEVIEALLSELKKRFKFNSLFIEVRNMFETDKTIFQRLGFNYEPHLEIIIDLCKDEEVLWSEVHSKRRNGIRRSVKEGCIFTIENNIKSLEDCHKILKEVYSRAKLPLHDITYFYELLTSSNESEGLRIFCAKHDEKIIGCMLALVFNDTIYDYYAGALSDYYKKYPNDLIPWEVFKWGKKNGYKKFCFGGAGKPDVPYGVRDYKKRFGGEMVEYGRYYYYSSKILYELAEKSFKLLQKLRGEK